MRPSALIFDAPAWWRRPGWRIAAAAAALAAWLVWWPASPPVDQTPVARRAPDPPPVAALSAPLLREAITPAATPLPAAASPAASSPPALSTLVAPGVHVTPLSVPAGTLPVPAGPSAKDSEPEN